MVKDAYYFLIPLLLLAFLTYAAGWTWLLWIWGPLAAFVAFFFRDPERRIPEDPAAIVSPADGKIILLEQSEEGTKVSIFLSVFDVHVNRAPIGGRVIRQEYRPGRFLVAYDSRASIENEQLKVTLGEERILTFSLIAGLVARRIVAWKQEGDRVRKGDRIGLIRFGSRVDILLPRDCIVTVVRGDRVRGGSSTLGYWESGAGKEAQRGDTQHG